jgi:hypothetical protein
MLVVNYAGACLLSVASAIARLSCFCKAGDVI